MRVLGGWRAWTLRGKACYCGSVSGAEHQWQDRVADAYLVRRVHKVSIDITIREGGLRYAIGAWKLRCIECRGGMEW